MSPDQQDNLSSWIAAKNAEMNGAMEQYRRDVNRLFEGMPPYVPPSRWVRAKRWPRLRMRRVRDRAARKIAPWLDDE